jgi:hypothetical protein
MKKLVTLQRVDTLDHAKRAFKQLEDALNRLAAGENASTAGGGGGQSASAGVPGTQGPVGPQGPVGSVGPPGVPGSDGVIGMVPTFIDVGEIFTVPVNRQALYTLPIINDGSLIVTGDLIEVS